MNPAGDTELQIGEDGEGAKPTMQDLWRKHPEIQNAAMIEAPVVRPAHADAINRVPTHHPIWIK
jgi:hypothetical protein